MDSSAVKVSMTADDFDSILLYAPDQASWITPDPWSAYIDLEITPWWLATYHRTGQVDASVSLTFNGPALDIYRFPGPDYGSFEVAISDKKTTLSACAAENGTMPHRLYKSDTLAYTHPHQ